MHYLPDASLVRTFELLSFEYHHLCCDVLAVVKQTCGNDGLLE